MVKLTLNLTSLINNILRTLVLLFIASLCLYVFLHFYYVMTIEHTLQASSSHAVNHMIDFLERKRRSVIELARSEYMEHLVDVASQQSSDKVVSIRKMHSFLQAYQVSFDYKELFIINVNDICIFSTVEKFIGKNIKQEVSNQGVFLASFDRIQMTLAPDVGRFGYSKLVDEWALFIMVPILIKGKLIGFLAIQVQDKDIKSLSEHVVQLGSTGEYIIAQYNDKQLIYISPDRAHDGMQFSPQTLSEHADLPIEQAVLGHKGSNITYDKDGRKIVQAWQYVPQLNWGLVIKVAYDEFAFLLTAVRYALYTLLVLIAALFVSKKGYTYLMQNS